jgi:hypothetical protein
MQAASHAQRHLVFVHADRGDLDQSELTLSRAVLAQRARHEHEHLMTTNVMSRIATPAEFSAGYDGHVPPELPHVTPTEHNDHPLSPSETADQLESTLSRAVLAQHARCNHKGTSRRTRAPAHSSTHLDGHDHHQEHQQVSVCSPSLHFNFTHIPVRLAHHNHILLPRPVHVLVSTPVMYVSFHQWFSQSHLYIVPSSQAYYL